MAKLDDVAIAREMQDLHTDWRCDGASLARRFDFKGYAKPVYTANLAAYLGDAEGHHPDVSFGWGYCIVTFTTHDAGGLTGADFRAAARLDRMVAGA